MLFERLTQDDASPYGICFRPSDGEGEAPFPHWEYTPGYLPPGMKIDMGEDVPLSEPTWFFIAQATAPDAYPIERQQPLNHAAGLNNISSATLTMPGAEHLSAPATAARDTGQVRFKVGNEHLMEIVFDENSQGKTQDLRPHLPLILRY
jgi:hypothetical protein